MSGQWELGLTLVGGGNRWAGLVLDVGGAECQWAWFVCDGRGQGAVSVAWCKMGVVSSRWAGLVPIWGRSLTWPRLPPPPPTSPRYDRFISGGQLRGRSFASGYPRWICGPPPPEGRGTDLQ